MRPYSTSAFFFLLNCKDHYIVSEVSLSSSPFFIFARWNKTMSWAYRSPGKRLGNAICQEDSCPWAFIKSPAQSQHKQQKCYSVMDFLLSATWNAHKPLFRIHWDRTAVNKPRIPKLEAHGHLRALRHSETPTTRLSFTQTTELSWANPRLWTSLQKKM